MTTKQTVLELIDSMPDNRDLEELLERLFLLQRLQRAEADVAAGRVRPHDEVMARAKEWLQ
jgi:predicted transcriptional regulator